MRTWLCIVVVAGACSKEPERSGSPPAEQPAAQPSAPAPAPASAPSKPVVKREAKAVAPTKAQRQEYRKHLRAGRKLGKEKRWGEAVVELEAALRAIPEDGMALSELGWAAFQAGDYPKARAANEDSVKRASDPKIKAASLYNLGRVAEAQGDKVAAANYYARSLALRPHKGVEETLAKLGQKPPEGDDRIRNELDLPCGDPRPFDEICACLLAAEPPDEGREDERECAPTEGELAPGFRTIVSQRYRNNSEWFLVESVGDRWRVVGVVGGAYNPGTSGIDEEFELGAAKIETVGARRVLRIQASHDRSDTDAGINEVATISTDTVTICVLGDGKEPTRCPFSVPVSYDYSRGILMEDLSPEEEAEIEHTPGIPIESSAKLALALAPDGAMTVTLTSGSLPEYMRAWLGPHKLW